MIQLLKAIQILGLRHLLKLNRAKCLAWDEIISGFYTTRTIQALFNVGFFDEMRKKGTVSIKSFATSKNLDKGILRSLCDSLVSLSILKKNGLGYLLDSKGELLVEVAPGWFYGSYGYEEVFHFLEALLKKEKAYGKDVERRPDFVARGSGEIEAKIDFPLAIDIITKGGFKKVLDLGCGEGTFLRELCKSNKEVTGHGVDLAPESIVQGRERVLQDGLQDRIQLAVLDISKMEKVPEYLQDIDAATIFFVLHEILYHGSDSVVETLQSFRNIFPGVPLIIFEAIRPSPEELRKKPGMAVQYLLQHEITQQKLARREEWKELFKKAGFSSIEERYLRFARTSIFTVR